MAYSGPIPTGFFIMILLYLMVRRGFNRLEVERAGKAGKKSPPPPRADEDTISPADTGVAVHSLTVIFFFVFVFFMFVYSIIYE